MRTLACSCAALAVALAAVIPVLAQPAMDPDQASPQAAPQAPTISSAPVPNSAQESPGVTSDQAVNPAPDAQDAYIGRGPKTFYDIDQRIAQVEQAMASLPPAQRRKAAALLRNVKAEEKDQIARHGQLRDWDRENLNAKLDQMAARFPALAG